MTLVTVDTVAAIIVLQVAPLKNATEMKTTALLAVEGQKAVVRLLLIIVAAKNPVVLQAILKSVHNL
jgi:hypothetical protein